MVSEGADALATLDAILAGEPVADPALFSRCTAQLSMLRNAIAAEGGDRVLLEHVNAVLSVVMAGHFPLGALPWAELHAARGWLAGVG